jgi:hypothetical protein
VVFPELVNDLLLECVLYALSPGFVIGTGEATSSVVAAGVRGAVIVMDDPAGTRITMNILNAWTRVVLAQTFDREVGHPIRDRRAAGCCGGRKGALYFLRS